MHAGYFHAVCDLCIELAFPLAAGAVYISLSMCFSQLSIQCTKVTIVAAFGMAIREHAELFDS